ncbi:MAG TPA: transglycosylase domain-containing protein, partial [bacterium]|nr:transglycosylase domain-containing protein [bacterium]
VSGSTITQQLVKKVFLYPDKTIERKIKEILISVRIEQKYSKDEILTAYLNQIPYGGNAYGIQAAAERYFNKNVEELNLAEATVLVGIPQKPPRNSPFSGVKFDLSEDLLVNPAEITETSDWYPRQLLAFSADTEGKFLIDVWRYRQIKALNNMIELGFITTEQAEEALAVPFTFEHPYEPIEAPHFVFYVRDQLEEKYGEKKLREGGLRVYTSLDYNLQKEAERIVADQINKIREPYNAHNSALVAMDPRTGEVLAYVGSVDYFDTANDGNVDVATSLRQPGSSFKPFAYAAAFQKGYHLNTLVIDASTDFGGGYRPRNYDGQDHGPVTLKTGLANSYNIPAVKALYIGGITETTKLATDLGITTLEGRAEACGLALTLGCAEVRLLDMVTAYSGFATMGKKVSPLAILKITDSQGKILEEFTPVEGPQAIDPGIAYMIADILSDNQARIPAFGWNTPLRLSRQAAVKTGTTNDVKDNWTVGFTPNLTVGVWVGNNNGDPLTGSASGVTGAAPIWHDFMEKAFETIPATDWYAMPASLTYLQVDSFSGLKPGEFTGENTAQTLILRSFVESLPTDDMRVKLTIDKQNGMIANPVTPVDLREERIYFKLHPVIPDNNVFYQLWSKAIEEYVNRSKEKDPNTVYAPPADISPSYYNAQNAPAVTITSPANQTVSTSKNITIAATATGPFPLVAIECYRGNEVIKSYTQMQDSYTCDYTLQDGSYTLTVKARDDRGAVGSASISVSVDTQFHVSILAPASKTYVTGIFDVQTSINSPNAIVNVDFRIDGTSKKTIASAPYSATIQAADGAHTLTVIASDNKGNTADAAISITVDSQAPASFSLTGTCTIKVGQSCLVTASPQDAGDAGIAYVEFYVKPPSGSVEMVQKITHTPATYTFKPDASGGHMLYALAYDRAGNKTQSKNLSVTVAP